MKSFSDLPNEILCEILSYFALEKQSLCQLARTSQLLSTLARPFMTRDIDFTKFEVDGIFCRYRRLIRNIERDPSIARSVRTVTMLTSSKAKVTNLSHRLLGGLPELRALKFVGDTESDFSYPWFLHKNPIPSLQNIIYDEPPVYAETIWKLMSLQGLENIIIYSDLTRNSIEGVDAPTLSDLKCRTSPVQSLDIGQIMLSVNFVREVLTCSRALKKLRCLVPQSEDPSTTPMEYILEPGRHSLTELVLIPWSNYRLPRMNLRGFGSLRVLELDYICLDTTRCLFFHTGIYRLLSPSLQEFRVRISFSLGSQKSLADFFG